MKDIRPREFAPQLDPFSALDSRLFSHLSLLQGTGNLQVKQVISKELLEDWFPWYRDYKNPEQFNNRRREQRSADSVCEKQKEAIPDSSSEEIVEFLGDRNTIFQNTWKTLCADPDSSERHIEGIVRRGVSGFSMLVGNSIARIRDEQRDTKNSVPDVILALRRNISPFLLWNLLDDGEPRHESLREDTFELLLFLSRHRMHINYKTCWEATGTYPLIRIEGNGASRPVNDIHDMDIISLLRLAKRARIPSPEYLPVCAAMVIAIQKLAGALLENRHLLDSPLYRRLLWESLDAVLWHATIRGLFAELKPEFAHLPVGMPLPSDSYLWLMAEIGYVVLGINRDLRIYEHYRRAMRHEILLYHARTEYRDHLFHAVATLLIGYLFLEGTQSPLQDFLPTQRKERTKMLRDWFLTAVFHDFGYVMELVPITLQLAEQFPVNSDQDLVAGLSSDWKKQVTVLNRSIQEQRCLRSDIGDGRTDHGVFSYLHLSSELRRLDAIAEGKVTLSGPAKTWKSVHCREHARALSAILKHNLFREPVDVRRELLSALLVLCDEIQEWQRPRYNEWELTQSSVATIHQQELRHMSMRRVCETIVFKGCSLAGRHVQFPSDPTVIILNYADQNANHFEPIMRLVSKIYNFERLEGLNGLPLVLEIRLNRLPRKPRLTQSDEDTNRYISELDILRDFCLLREVGISPELFTLLSSLPPAPRRCISYECKENGERRVRDVVRLDWRKFRKRPREKPLISIPPWEFEKQLFQFKREYCRRHDVNCTLFRDDDEWPEQQIGDG